MNQSRIFPRVGGVFAILSIFIVFNILAGVLQFGLESTVPSTLLGFIVYTTAVGGTALVVYLIRKSTNGSLAPIPMNKVKLFPMIVMAIGAIACVSALDPLLSLIPMSQIFLEAMEEMLVLDIWTFLTVCVGAAVLEEIIFRGVLLDGLLRNFKAWPSIIVSGLIFGLIHFNLTQAVGASILGIFIGWVYWKTKSLIPVIFIHFVNNTASYLSVATGDVELTDNFWTYVNQGDYTFVYISIAAVPIAILSIYYLVNYFKNNPVEFERPIPQETI